MADLPALDLADGFAHQVQQWALEAGAEPEDAALAARAARALSLATSEGHVCLRLDELDEAEALRAGLRASRIAGTPQAPGSLPLILDGERLYLHRHFDFERRLARRLARARIPDQPVTPRARALLRELFASDAAPPGGGADWQQLAAALALRSPLLVVSGGPGTGKTTAVAKLLAVLLAQAPQARIALAAPTGKAAARLSEALRERGIDLPPELRARLPAQASTVHRLLGAQGPGRFTHHAGHRLPIDALVVDEASMLDLALATRLLEAVPPGARIVLLGDKDQLAAVEAGAVFAEISADPGLSEGCIRELAALCDLDPAAIAPPEALLRTGLTDRVVWLQHNFRFGAGSAIGRLAQDINAGRVEEALALLRRAGTHAEGALCWLPDAQATPTEGTRQRLLAGFGPYIEALRRDPGDVAAVTAAFNRFRILAVLREGPRGVAALNPLVAGQVQRALGAAPQARGGAWYPGRAVLVTRNDEMLRLFNGDVGIALPDADGALRVMFPDGAGLRAVAPARLPPHQDAFALTVHRAQGSEFDEVALVLPEHTGRALSRELLYTGLTRSRGRVTLVGSAAVIEAAIASPTRHHSGLIARLREELA
ncbi:exodeoxyribonuclease V subunit alpha [Azohydromonas caseinilytica]|uniref:RecBCD enzyme subunit RecD n=1 Tax=Azohydromonas caseinilytica TaxID=2728836 RepID=A0A848F845_9BURK|nr:exodeoxyribonuclease V subunit alpha [Azohydromonas caseinilytica]NML14936.1 exodeoxyribonuclease V subunit alpha [Azohydromonas caseinilytica]